MTPTLSKRAKNTVEIVRGDLRDFIQTRGSSLKDQLDERQRRALADLKRDGFAIVEDYWPRAQALELRDRLATYHEGGPRDLDGGAYFRSNEGNPYDSGVRRLFHVDKVLPELEAFRFDPFILDLVEAYYRIRYHSGMLMYQFNEFRENRDNSTRYFHVDSFRKEAKAFLYLDDVDEANGPFTYLPRSHRAHLTRIRKQVSGNKQGAPTSFDPSDLGWRLKRERLLCGSAGTLIVADVRGLHRGSPQLERSRAVLVNYILRHEREVFPGR